MPDFGFLEWLAQLLCDLPADEIHVQRVDNLLDVRAEVYWCDGAFRIQLADELFSERGRGRLLRSLAHECGHIVLGHCPRRESEWRWDWSDIDRLFPDRQDEVREFYLRREEQAEKLGVVLAGIVEGWCISQGVPFLTRVFGGE
jgi:hypothetical protein